MAIDLFFLESDRHRVVLLASTLARLGVDARLRSEPVATRSDPSLVFCTRAGLDEPWLADLFLHDGALVALLLEGVMPPRDCTRAVDLTSWPARSADAEVAALARWVKHPDAYPGFGLAAARRFQRGRAQSARAGRDGPGGWLAAGLLAGLTLGFGVLIWWSADGSDDSQSGGERQLSRSSGVGGGTSAPGASGGMPAAGPSWRDASARSPAQNGIAGAAALGNDTLSRLCRAQDPDSARAWLGALNWKQRRRLDSARCVQRLATRPGFESFAALLERQSG